MHYLDELETFIIQDNKYEILSESAWLCRRCDEKHLVCFGFAIPIAVHLQNANAVFYQVV